MIIPVWCPGCMVEIKNWRGPISEQEGWCLDEDCKWGLEVVKRNKKGE